MSEIKNYISSKEAEIIKTLSALVAIPSVMGKAEADAPFGKEPKRALLEMSKLCESAGFVVNNYENAVITADLYPEKGIELGILCHLDVVPAEPADWKTPPFELTEKNGVLYGRGAIDDKGPAAAVFYAAKCVKELGLPLKKGLRLIFGTNEENGSDDLEIYKKYEKFPPKVFTPDGSFPVINIEKGMFRSNYAGKLCENSPLLSFHGGKIPNAVPDFAECELKNISLDNFCAAVKNLSLGAEFEAALKDDILSIKCKGKAAHASTPEAGQNAVTALIALINKLINEPTLKALEQIFPFGETDGNSLGIKCSDESGALTCVFSILDIENQNVSCTADVRFPCRKNLDFVKEKEIKAFEKARLALKDHIGDEPHIVPEDSEFVKTLLSVYERFEGEKGRCIAIGGGTYVHNIEGGVAFGAERGDTDYNMHGANEFITVSELLRDAELFARVIAEVCG